MLNLLGAWMGGRDGRLDLISSHRPSVGSYHCDGFWDGGHGHGHGHGHHPCGAAHGALTTMISGYVHQQLSHHHLCHRCHHHEPQADLCECLPRMTHDIADPCDHHSNSPMCATKLSNMTNRQFISARIAMAYTITHNFEYLVHH